MQAITLISSAFILIWLAMWPCIPETPEAPLRNCNRQIRRTRLCSAWRPMAYENMGDKARARDYYEKIMTINLHNPSNAFARPMAREKLATLGSAGTAQKP